MAAKPKLILAGGSGFIGKALARHFSDWEIVVLNRSPEPQENCRVVAWDGKTQGAWTIEVDGAEAKRMLEYAHEEALRVAATARADAEAAGRRRERLAMDRISAAEQAAVRDVRVTAAEVASAAAERMIAEGLTADADAALIDRAISGLPAALVR